MTTTGNSTEYHNRGQALGAMLWAPIELFLIDAFAIFHTSDFGRAFQLHCALADELG